MCRPRLLLTSINSALRSSSVFMASPHSPRIALVDPAPLVVDYGLPALLTEWAALLPGQDAQNRLRWPAKAYAERGHNDGSVDENGVGQHSVENLVIRKAGVVQAELSIQGLVSTH